MQTRTSDALADYHKANGIAVAAPHETDRLPFRQALPVWLMMAVGGWLIVGLLFEIVAG